MTEIDNSMLAELEQESRLMRARNARLEAEVTVLTEMVRVLSDKMAEMDAKNEIETLKRCLFQMQEAAQDLVRQAKQEQGEPVAWMRHDGQRVTTASDRHNYPDYETRYSIPLYTTPQQRTWVGLTESEMWDCESNNYINTCKALLAKSKEKNA
jgi:hypothetical protein